MERIISAVLGGVFVVNGLKRRSLAGSTMAAAGASLLYRGFSGHSPLYTVLGTSTAKTDQAETSLTVGSSITVAKPAEEIYQLWRDPQKLAPVLDHFAELKQEEGGRMRWRVQALLGRTLEFETQIVEDRPGELLRWQSTDGATTSAEGSLQLRPAPDHLGTEVTLRFQFQPPGGAVGTMLLKQLRLLPRTLATKALRRCKSLLETGEIPTLAGSPSARETVEQQ